MSDEPEMRIVNVPVNTELYDAVAREAGFRDFADLQAKAEAERAALPPYIRDLCDEVDRKLDEAFLGVKTGT